MLERPAYAPSFPSCSRSGFTLIELMIVVAIVSILVTIAIPSFLRFQMRTKASEGKVNLEAIAKAEQGYFAASGTYVNVAAPVPAAVPAAGRQAWVAGTDFDILGFAPEGTLYFVYLASADNAGGPGASLVRFTAEAASDIDGDGLFNYWGYVRPGLGGTSGIAGMIAGSTCVGTGVYDATSMLQDVLSTVGPCDAMSGQSQF